MDQQHKLLRDVPSKPEGKPDFKAIRQWALDESRRRFTVNVATGKPASEHRPRPNPGRAVALVWERWKRRQGLSKPDRLRRWRNKSTAKAFADFWWLVEAGREAPDAREEAVIRIRDAAADLARLDSLKDKPGGLTDYWRELAAIYAAAREAESKDEQNPPDLGSV